MHTLSNLQLKENEVHIWSAYLPDFETTQAYHGVLLSKEEIKKAYQFKFKKDSKKFIITRSILRYLLASYLVESPQKIELIYGPWGKPYLSGKERLRFNVTHSKNYALFAITKYYEVGIDLEFINKNFNFYGILEVIFSKEDLCHWQKLTLADQITFL